MLDARRADLLVRLVAGLEVDLGPVLVALVVVGDRTEVADDVAGERRVQVLPAASPRVTSTPG